MQELRWNPMHQWWVMVASNRQNRPLMPKDWCPFCPESKLVPENYLVYSYPNDFPALSAEPPIPTAEHSLTLENQELVSRIFKKQPSFGSCEIILYSSNHHARLYEIPKEHLLKLVLLWQQRHLELSTNLRNKYIYIFENRGEAVGVTMPHPHGQIYAYPFIPSKIQAELDYCFQYQQTYHSNFHDDWLIAERSTQTRMVYEADGWSALVPFWAEYPYQLTVIPQKKLLTLADFSEQDLLGLGKILQKIVWMYDHIFDITFPFMMVFHSAPVNTGENYDYYRFQVEFYPPLRSAGTQKFNASSETGAWAYGNPVAPEEKAAEMRNLIQQPYPYEHP